MTSAESGPKSFNSLFTLFAQRHSSHLPASLFLITCNTTFGIRASLSQYRKRYIAINISTEHYRPFLHSIEWAFPIFTTATTPPNSIQNTPDLFQPLPIRPKAKDGSKSVSHSSPALSGPTDSYRASPCPYFPHLHRRRHRTALPSASGRLHKQLSSLQNLLPRSRHFCYSRRSSIVAMDALERLQCRQRAECGQLCNASLSAGSTKQLWNNGRCCRRFCGVSWY